MIYWPYMNPESEAHTEAPIDMPATLARVLELEQENNKMLKHMQIVGRISFWAKVAIWALILGLPVLFFQPIVEFLSTKAAQGRTLYGIPSSEQIKDAIHTYTTNN